VPCIAGHPLPSDDPACNRGDPGNEKKDPVRHVALSAKIVRTVRRNTSIHKRIQCLAGSS
jgi:hypothetical protein